MNVNSGNANMDEKKTDKKRQDIETASIGKRGELLYCAKYLMDAATGIINHAEKYWKGQPDKRNIATKEVEQLIKWAELLRGASKSTDCIDELRSLAKEVANGNFNQADVIAKAKELSG